MYSKQVFAIRTPFGVISVIRLTALLKLEITVCFFWHVILAFISYAKSSWSQIYRYKKSIVRVWLQKLKSIS